MHICALVGSLFLCLEEIHAVDDDELDLVTIQKFVE